MFHEKDHTLAIKRSRKKKNINKEDKQHNDWKQSAGTFYGIHKAMQQELIDECGIRVHKNTLRGMTDICMKQHYVFNPEFDPLVGNEKRVGNVQQNELDHVLSAMSFKKQHIVENARVHDKTRWKRNKDKSVSRLNQRADKDQERQCDV